MQVPLLPLLDECKGGLKAGKCASDPQNGVVTKSTADCCSGLCDTTFQLGKVISPKQCSACSKAELQAPKVPKTGDLPTNTIVDNKLIPKIDGST